MSVVRRGKNERFLLVVIAMAVLSLQPVRAHALCDLSNLEVAQVNLNGTNNFTFIFLRPCSTCGATFSATTTNPNVIGAAENAVHTRTKVFVRGSVAACSASGSIGTVILFITP